MSDTNHLFLGDFIDRWFYSVETFLLLLVLNVSPVWVTTGSKLDYTMARIVLCVF